MLQFSKNMYLGVNSSLILNLFDTSRSMIVHGFFSYFGYFYCFSGHKRSQYFWVFLFPLCRPFVKIWTPVFLFLMLFALKFSCSTSHLLLYIACDFKSMQWINLWVRVILFSVPPLFTNYLQISIVYLHDINW